MKIKRQQSSTKAAEQQRDEKICDITGINFKNLNNIFNY